MSKSSEEWWTTYEEMHKVEKIIRDILGWECFTSWESYQHKYGMREWGYIAGEKFTTPTHVAFYDSEWRVWSPDHETLDIFDPLHKLDDAWLLIEPIKKHAHSGTVRSRFVEAVKLLDHAWRHYTKEQFCQAICDAALCILDREVPLSEELPDPGAIDTYIDGLKQVQRLAEMIEEQGTIEGTKEFQRLQWLAERIEKRREQT